MSDSLWAHRLQYAKLPCPSATPRACSGFMVPVIPSNHLILCCPLLLLPSIFPSIRVFPNESGLCVRWPKYWSFSFSFSPSNECSGLFPLEWNGWTPCSPRDSQQSSLTPQFKSINSSAFSLLYGPMLTSICDYWKNHSLTIWTFVSKVMSLLFNMLSRFVIAFLLRSKCLNFMAAVTICSDFGAPQK